MSPCGTALVAVPFVLLAALFVPTELTAQWVKYQTAGVPRKTDGTVNMAAPAPRLADGKTDFSGIWAAGEPYVPDQHQLTPEQAATRRKPRNLKDDKPVDADEINGGRQMSDIGIDLPGGLPYQLWLASLVKKRTVNKAIDDPHIRCLPDNFLRAYELPHALKFVQSTSLLVMLNEMNAGYRQVFTDGRPLPRDPVPSWQGYSSGKWTGDTLVIATIGLRDDTWIDWNGSVLPEQAKVREEIRRPDFGHLEIRVTVDDPKAYM
jgi:hypothetical protein